jgi:hypothetical protein
MQCLRNFFRKKLRVLPLFEIDIFADLTNSKEAKSGILALTFPTL